MALRLRHWLWTVGFGLAAVLIVTLPLERDPIERRGRLVTPEADRLRDVGHALALQEDALLKLRWLDDVEDDLREARAEGRTWIWDAPDGSSDPGWASQVAAFTERLGDEVRRARWSEEADVGAFLVGLPEREAGDPPGVRSGQQVFVGEVDGRPYCLVTDWRRTRRPGMHLARWSETTGGGILGPCRYFLRYGPPGRNLRPWLKRGAMGFGRFEEIPAEQATAARASRRTLGQPFTLRLRMERCVRGDAPACERLFTQGGLTRASERSRANRLEDAVPELWSNQFWFPAGYTLFATLEREFGTERFRRFWTSDLHATRAFEAAFGVPVDAWMHRWLDEQIPPRRTTAGFTSWLWTLLVLGASLATATFTARRREAG